MGQQSHMPEMITVHYILKYSENTLFACDYSEFQHR
jgi:hypothetical protein